MKAMNTIIKILTALATIAGVVYIVATYGEQIVEWCKKTLEKLPKCPKCEEAEDDAEIEVEITVEKDADESAEEAPAEGSDEASEADGAEESAPLYSRSLVGYLDASHESCVVFLADSRAESPDDCLDEEALTALLESAVKAVTLEE